MSDATYRFLSNLLAVRARRLPKPVIQDRVETAFKDLCRDLSPTLCLEVGAHEAAFSTWMKEHVPGARCVAFEANPYVHEKYAPALADTGVEYLHLAVSETSGSVNLTIPRRMSEEGRGRRKRKQQANRMASVGGTHRYAEESETVTVPSVPLDEFVTLGDDDVLVAWIDVEGASGIVLPSGGEVLARASLVYIEVESEPVWDGQWLDVDVARFLSGLGLVPIARDIQRRHQYNVIFASAELAADPAIARRCNRLYRPLGATAGGRRRGRPRRD